MHFHGKLTGLSHGLLFGWVYDPERLQERIVVEIVGDDYPLALARAQVWLQELAEIGDGCYGFCQALPLNKLQGVRRLRARVANSDYWLEGAVYPETQVIPPVSPLLGYTANRNGLHLYGWALDPAKPKEAVKLEFYENNRLLGHVVANQKNAELAELDIGAGRHAFEFTLPFALADGKRHEIKILNQQGQTLKGSPLQVITYPQTIDAYLAATPADTSRVDYFRVLARQYQYYQNYLPSSLSFSAYADWAKHFAHQAPKPAAQNQRRFLILVSGDGDLNPTLHSLILQTHQPLQVLVRGESTIADQRIVYAGKQDWQSFVCRYLADHEGLLGFVKAGDTLPPHALAELNLAFENPAVQMAYSDCDFAGNSTLDVRPWFKPDWDYDLFLAQQLTHHAFAVRSGILPIDSPWISYPETWPWLAIGEIGDNAEAICHINTILYHCHQDNISPELESGIAALLPKLEPKARIRQKIPELNMRILEWQPPETWPMVSLIIPTRDHKLLLEKCIASLEKTDYPELEIIVVDNDSQDEATLRYLGALENKNIKVIRFPHRFNYASINNYAVSFAQGEVIGLINDDIEAIDRKWLKSMVTHLLRPGVGAVGAKLLWPNGMVQHAGVLLGLDGIAGHIGNNWEENDLGYYAYNQVVRKVSAVTAACLICNKSDYLALGGLDEQAFPVAFNDVDFCLRLGELGKHILWTPDAKLWHAESASRGRDDTPEKLARLEKEKSELLKRWGKKLFSDPFYNINLNLDRYSHNGLAFPPRSRDWI